MDIFSFTSGLQLLMADWQLDRPTLIQNFFKNPSVGFGFCIDGRFDYQPACFGDSFAVKAGESGFFSFPTPVESFEKTDNKPMSRMLLLLEGEALFKMAKGDENQFYPVLKNLDKKDPVRIGHCLTPLMKGILHQMRNCPYQGVTRRFFMEGKAMELLAHKLEQLNPGNGSRESSVKSSDVERVHHAAQLLVHDLENPPDIMTLSRKSGLNRNKLHYCFRDVFGLSPFEYLRNQRLQTAMLLLQDGEFTVTQAALMVGYTNLSYFAKVFKSTFGIAPGALRKCASVSRPDG
ncbi:MAG: AraC family transcriptional regulator [Desulfobacterales bacterium]|nr:AraC family transcriptional regulator [Desulfobacterales bacterium]